MGTIHCNVPCLLCQLLGERGRASRGSTIYSRKRGSVEGKRGDVGGKCARNSRSSRDDCRTQTTTGRSRTLAIGYHGRFILFSLIELAQPLIDFTAFRGGRCRLEEEIKDLFAILFDSCLNYCVYGRIQFHGRRHKLHTLSPQKRKVSLFERAPVITMSSDPQNSLTIIRRISRAIALS